MAMEGLFDIQENVLGKLDDGGGCDDWGWDSGGFPVTRDDQV